jgi:hypothetical protein
VNAVLANCETQLESNEIAQRNFNAVIDPFRLAIATKAPDAAAAPDDVDFARLASTAKQPASSW